MENDTETIILAHCPNAFNVRNELDKVVLVSESKIMGIWGRNSQPTKAKRGRLGNF